MGGGRKRADPGWRRLSSACMPVDHGDLLSDDRDPGGRRVPLEIVDGQEEIRGNPAARSVGRSGNGFKDNLAFVRRMRQRRRRRRRSALLLPSPSSIMHHTTHTAAAHSGGLGKEAEGATEGGL